MKAQATRGKTARYRIGEWEIDRETHTQTDRHTCTK